ncbi:hypothetical protein [Iningainema tapete]|uniref:Uncharacterized protein n=1 Tax=Iningainema tapete BLCC-T55 TaxID=2748662 RepID=A0A8J7C8U1_9CYAN|nr:hypothetical protein [Iningainema tapete]MBD2775126.1 hypothetical protein [Iningainema tapete BLCC-T55]
MNNLLPKSIIGFALLTTLTLVGCNRNAQEPTASTTEAPAATSTTQSTTATNVSLPTEAQKLGVKPQGETTCPSNAPVKGKVTKKRGNIYHAPKTPDFDKVKPDICFKDTATAQKAGFKAPS